MPPVPRRRLVPADGLLVLAIIVIPPVVLVLQPSITDKSLTLPLAIGATLAAAIVLVRRWWPVPLLALALVGTLVLVAVTRDRTPLMVAVVVMLYTVASSTDDRRTGRRAGLVTMVLLFGATTILLGEPVLGPNALAVIAWTSLAVAAGGAVRSRRDYVVAIEDRARRAEESREQEARRRVAEERLRIARDVHDVVAHRMAVISVQAAAAGALLSVRPDEAAVAIERCGHRRRPFSTSSAVCSTSCGPGTRPRSSRRRPWTISTGWSNRSTRPVST